ncbi:MAG: N-acetylmuramoyl-L-alanine amidase [Deltaproteobacteria bacterium]|nr:N-acetylmuramoyl-L-alanine amidase [Deltaproteobacteria bacterium]
MKWSHVFTICILFWSLTLFAEEKNALTDYAFAQKCYHSLDKTTAKGWDRCVHQFEAIVKDYPKSQEAPKALFSVGRLSEEKYNVTHNEGDLQNAFKSYNEFLKRYSSHPMSDDALYRIGVLRHEKQRDKVKAEKAFHAVLERFPNGDMAVPAQDYLGKLEGTGGGGDKGLVTSDQETVNNPVITVKPPIEEITDLEEDLPPPTKKLKPDSQNEFQINTVVIDPGHGGDDPGAIGPKGTKEAVVALQIARKVAFKLKNELGLTTYLTRTRNETLPLEDRDTLANKKKADLFISIHANANDSPKVSGVQTYYLNNATNQAAKRLAARENRASKKQLNVSDTILSTMLQNANTEESRDLARAVQKSLLFHLQKKYPPVKNLKVDSALFYVLVGAKCPGILVETSFITNPKEEKRLKDSEYQWTLAEAITKGVKQYVNSRQKVASSL